MRGTLVTDEKWLDPALCPYGAITETEQGQKLDRTLCSHCRSRECVTKKRTKGIRNSCTEVSKEELLREIVSSSMMFYDGGGVTFTGGECTMQSEELSDLLRELTRMEVHTALETNGTYRALPELFPYVSQLIMDCKLIDEEKHRQWTGVSNTVVQQNLRTAARRHPCVHIRVPLIGGVNNAPEEIDRFIVFFQELQELHDRENPEGQLTFEILKYHEYGKKKWMECGWDYQMTDQARVTAQEVKDFQKHIEEAGLPYKKT